MGMVGRRRFLAGAGGLLVLPHAMAEKRPARVGLSFRFSSAAQRKLHVESMSQQGWRDEKDFVFIEPPKQSGDWSDLRKVRKAIAGVLLLSPDILVVNTTAHAVEAYRRTKTLPIVMIVSGYPVEAGIADSLAHPGRNVTGNAIYAGTGIWGKLLELLKEVRPNARRIAVLWTYARPAFPDSEIEQCLRDIRRDAAALGVEPNIVEPSSEARGPQALEAIGAGEPDALLLTSLPYFSWKSWPKVMELAVARRLPTVMDLPPLENDARPQPLMHYGPSITALRDRAYGYVVRILKGANVGELPIQQPEKFDLIVNLKSARAINLRLPQSILARADRVIE
jgi:putative ABC transport system substrate-binding protein